MQFLICLLLFNTQIKAIDTWAIAHQVEQDANSWFRRFSKLYEAEKGGFWCSSYKNYYVNGKVQLTVSHANEVLAIADDIVAFLERHDLPFYWLINVHNDSELVSQALIARGFEEELNYVMLHDLKNICKKHMPGLSIKAIDIRDILSWLNVYNLCFGQYDSAFTDAYAQVIRNDIDHGEKKYYAGYIDNRLVAIGRILIYPTYSYLKSIATHPAYRNRGIASHMVETLLEIALKNGSQYALLEAGSAVPVYEKVGFKKIIKLYGFEYRPINEMRKKPCEREPFILFGR